MAYERFHWDCFQIRKYLYIPVQRYIGVIQTLNLKPSTQAFPRVVHRLSGHSCGSDASAGGELPCRNRIKPFKV